MRIVVEKKEINEPPYYIWCAYYYNSLFNHDHLIPPAEKFTGKIGKGYSAEAAIKDLYSQ